MADDEKPNAHDMREKLISITQKGKHTLYRIYEGFQHIQDVMVDLSVEEREKLISILKALDEFHTKNHANIIKSKLRKVFWPCPLLPSGSGCYGVRFATALLSSGQALCIPHGC